MANIPIASGVMAYAGTLIAAQADTVSFADRLGYVTVTNTGAAGNIYATSNGTVPTDTTSAETGSVEIPPGQTVMLANGAGLWSQAQNVLVAGTVVVGNGAAYNASTNPSTPTQPGQIAPYGSSLAGKGSANYANTGFVVGLISTGTPTYLIQAAG